MIIQTLNYSLAVKGLSYDVSTFGSVTLTGFDSLTVNNVISFTWDDFVNFPVAPWSREIGSALDQAAEKEAQDWQETSKDLRAWLAYRRG